METSIRNIEFRLYPTKSQEVTLVGLVGWLRLHCELYNAALNILAKGLVQTGWEPSEVWSRVAAAVKRENTAMPLAA